MAIILLDWGWLFERPLSAFRALTGGFGFRQVGFYSGWRDRERPLAEKYS
ncbi:hypothetical protein [Rubidibacter lacunae]|nr:hypothetical protein [Rubidibacter lacunae]